MPAKKRASPHAPWVEGQAPAVTELAAEIAQIAEAHPQCCNDDMVSYMGEWFFECSDAYFRLRDDGAIEDDGSSPPRLIKPASAFHKALHGHLLSTRLATCEVCEQRSLTQWPDGTIVHECPVCSQPGATK